MGSIHVEVVESSYRHSCWNLEVVASDEGEFNAIYLMPFI